MLLPLEVFCKYFVNISHTRRLSMAASYHFLTTIAFWLMKYLLWIDGDNLRVLAKDLTLSSIYRSNLPLWNIHGIA